MTQIEAVQIGTATLHLQNVQISEGVVLEEVHLEGGDIRLQLSGGKEETVAVSTGEVRLHAIARETTVNRLLAENLPPDAPVRNLRVSLLSGRMQIRGQFVKSVMSLPFTLEAIPKIENGVRVSLDFRSAHAAGLDVPTLIVEVVSRLLNEHMELNLTRAPFPVWLDEVRCEPGRLSLFGRARLAWPPAPSQNATHAFAPREVVSLPREPDVPALSNPDAAHNVILPSPDPNAAHTR